jgi:FMN phosphatase YigB (HAD superfamily)
LLAGIRRQGLRVGIITNLGDIDDATGWGYLVASGLSEYVDRTLFISDNAARVPKPDPAIFHFAAEKAAVPPERALFIGENLLELIGAAAAGMHTLWKPTSPGKELPVV